MNREPVLVYGGAVVTGKPGGVLPGAGVVLAEGTIAAVGPVEELRRAYGGMAEVGSPRWAVLPGMINAHTHLELGFLRGAFGPGAFPEWVRGLVRRVARETDLAGAVGRAVREGMAESLRFGVTAVGDISRQVAASRAVLREGPVRAVSFGEVMGIGAWRGRAEPLLAAAADESAASPTLRIGLSPHAPYTVEGPVLRKVVEEAARKRLPVCMHLAELAEEGEFLAALGGPLRAIWEMGGPAEAILDERIPHAKEGALAWGREWGLLDGRLPAAGVPVVLAHGNYVSAGEMDLLANSGASVVYCPRTRVFFGHEARGRHPFRELLERGVNVCLGTDSLASAPDLSVLREAQALWRLRPETPAEWLIEMLTWRGARALGMEERVGSLEVGKAADVVAVELEAEDMAEPRGVAEALVSRAPDAAAVWVGGVRVG